MQKFVRDRIDWGGAPVKDRIRHFQKLAKAQGGKMTWAEAKAAYRKLEADEIWVNDEYQVNLAYCEPSGPDAPPMVHLSIKRRDKGPVRDWRDFQEIKNQLVGPNCEGVELFPAEDRLVDTANQYHLWVIADPDYRFPFGFSHGREVSSKSSHGSVQRPLVDEEKKGPGGEPGPAQGSDHEEVTP